MARLTEFRYTLGVAWCGYALLGALLLTGQQAPQVRSVTEGVYSVGQAARGQQLYTAQCASCHGKAMEGSSGPPLVGETFLSDWSAKSLANLVDKIQKTMPYDHPATLSRSQATDLAADVLQTDKFPSGQAELSEAALVQIVFPTVRSAAAPISTTGMSFLAPEGNLAELMRAIAFPAANTLFNVQIKDPGKEPVKKMSSTAPFDYVEWGTTIYPGWQAIELAGMALTETAPLLSTPGRRCQNGKPVPVDRADWKQYVNDLAEVGRLARRTAQARNFEAFIDISEKLNDACLNCHRVYRDRGGREGSGALRCQPPAPAPAPAK